MAFCVASTTGLLSAPVHYRYEYEPVLYSTPCEVGIFLGTPPYAPAVAYLDGLCAAAISGAQVVQEYSSTTAGCPVIGGTQSAKYTYYCGVPLEPSTYDCRDGVGRITGTSTYLIDGNWDDSRACHPGVGSGCYYNFVPTGGGFIDNWACTSTEQCFGFRDLYITASLCCPGCSPGCYCDATDTCVPCDTDGDCAVALGTYWDPTDCQMHNTEPPACAPGLAWDWCECQCSAGGNCPTKRGEHPDQGHNQWRDYGIAYVVGKRVKFESWDFPRPTGSSNSNATVTVQRGSTRDRHPSWCRNHRTGSIDLAYERSQKYIYLATSQDDGRTWDLEETPVLSATRPQVRSTSSMTIVAGRSTSSAIIVAKRKLQGESTYGAAFTFVDSVGTALPCQDDIFSLTPAPDSAQSWLLAVKQSGTIELWISYDDCATWTLLT